MTSYEFDSWLKKLKKAWENRDPQAAADLCAENLEYLETPFSEPLKTKKEVLEEWKSVENQKDVSLSYEIISIFGNHGIAHFSATFTRIPSSKKVHLDGIFQVKLDENNLCTEFRWWYNEK